MWSKRTPMSDSASLMALRTAAGAPLEEDEARDLVAANLCRCTGYQGIVEAVLATARARRKP